MADAGQSELGKKWQLHRTPESASIFPQTLPLFGMGRAGFWATTAGPRGRRPAVDAIEVGFATPPIPHLARSSRPGTTSVQTFFALGFAFGFSLATASRSRLLRTSCNFRSFSSS